MIKVERSETFMHRRSVAESVHPVGRSETAGCFKQPAGSCVGAFAGGFLDWRI